MDGRNDETDLRARWREDAPGGGTRREGLLLALREGQLARSQDGQADLRGISLIGEDLTGVDLTGCNLAGADLSEADLSGAKLIHCNLRGATLFKTKLDESELLGADLTGATLSECIATRAGFGHANLSQCEMFQANLEGATLSGAKLAGSDLRAANLEKARIRECDLTRANFARARLRLADLDRSDVEGSNFENADLREARLRALKHFDKAYWVGTDFRNVDFTGAYLLRRFVMDENYLFEFRAQGRYSRFVYRLWWLTSNCGRSPIRWLAWNVVVALLFGGAYLMIGLDYGKHRTVLSPFYYSFVTLTTLGYGDVVPASATAQVVATMEVLLGYVGLGGLLSILANKMARRAD